MKRKILLLSLIVLLMLCSSAFAAAERVVFYPSGADFSQQLKSAIKTDVNGEYVVFTLPGQAVPETFTISSLTKGVAVNDVAWNRSDLSQSPAAIELGKKIDQLKFKLRSVMAQKKAVDGGIAFWKGMGKEQLKSAELEKIAGQVVSSLSKLYAESVKLDENISDLQDLIDELYRNLNDMTGGGKGIWTVKVSVAGNGAKSADFTIGYMLQNCGWTPKYKLDAYPDSGKIRFTFEAEINQGSGIDFKNCEIALATVKKMSRISPPELGRWRIEPTPEPEPERYMNMAMEAAPVATKMRAAAPAPRRVSKATYSLWEMGKRTIPAGSTRKYAVETEDWAGEFTFLARPSLTPDIFVSAKTNLKEARDYPSGPALIFMEGAMIGKRSFSFSGKEKTFYFGSDPMLKAERKTLEKQSGEQGLFGSKQTYNWKYKVELENARKKAVKILVQEPAPVPGDKQIKLVISSEPSAETKDDNFEWTVDVPAGAKASLTYSVDLKAPGDMDLDLGLGK